MFPFAVGCGAVILIASIAYLYFGIKTPEGKKVSMGLGTYYDRTGILVRAIMGLFTGVLLTVVGFFIQG